MGKLQTERLQRFACMDGACCSSTAFVKAPRVPCVALLLCMRTSWLPGLCAALLLVAYHFALSSLMCSLWLLLLPPLLLPLPG